MIEYLRVAKAAFRHNICPVLAHAQSVTVAFDCEKEAAACIFNGEGGAAQSEKRSHLLPRALDYILAVGIRRGLYERPTCGME